MKQNKIFIGMLIAALFIAGCYTQLMTPQEYVEARQQKIKAEKTFSSASHGSSINYDRNCLSCHSRYELEDRYGEMQAAGISTAHGYIITPDAWVYEFIPTYNPDPYGWYNPLPPIPWWMPPSTAPAIGGTQQTSSSSEPSKGRQRDDGPSRSGGTTVREPVPVYVPPPSSGGTTSSPSTPAPAVSSAPTTSTPTTQTTQSTSTDNSRKTSSGDSSRRNDGPSRPR